MATLITHTTWAVTLPAELGGLRGCGRGHWSGYVVAVLTAPHTDVVRTEHGGSGCTCSGGQTSQ